MKKLVFLFAAILLTAISAKTFAQSTGITPAPGATHEYTITPGNSGNEILWTVTKDDLTTPAGGDAVISADDSTTTNIKWDVDNTEIGTWYYIHVLETEGSGATACSNEKVLPVKITASPFTLDLVAANGAQCYDDAVELNLNTTTHTVTYDHGTATLEFKVTPTGLSSNYSGYTFNVAIGYGTYTYSSNLDDSNVTISSGDAGISSGVVTVNDNEPVIIKYIIDNQNVFDNDSDSDAQDYTATVTISNGVSDNGVTDNTSGDHTEDTAVARPNTSSIGYN